LYSPRPFSLTSDCAFAHLPFETVELCDALCRGVEALLGADVAAEVLAPKAASADDPTATTTATAAEATAAVARAGVRRSLRPAQNSHDGPNWRCKLPRALFARLQRRQQLQQQQQPSTAGDGGADAAPPSFGSVEELARALVGSLVEIGACVDVDARAAAAAAAPSDDARASSGAPAPPPAKARGLGDARAHAGGDLALASARHVRGQRARGQLLCVRCGGFFRGGGGHGDAGGGGEDEDDDAAEEGPPASSSSAAGNSRAASSLSICIH